MDQNDFPVEQFIKLLKPQKGDIPIIKGDSSQAKELARQLSSNKVFEEILGAVPIIILRSETDLEFLRDMNKGILKVLRDAINKILEG